MAVHLVSPKKINERILYHHRDLKQIRALTEMSRIPLATVIGTLHCFMHEYDLPALLELLVGISKKYSESLKNGQLIFSFCGGRHKQIPPLYLLVISSPINGADSLVLERIQISIVDSASEKCLRLKYTPEPVKKNFFAKLWDAFPKRSKE